MGKCALHVILAIAILGVVVAAGVGGDEPKPVVSVADFHDPESPTSGIQEAIDALPPEGGVVIVPPGTYRLRQSVVLRSHVALRGSGSTSVLTRGPEVHAKLTQPARKGETSAQVESTEGFLPGDEVALLDSRMHGWYLAHPIVKQVEPGRLTFAEPIASGHAEGVFRPEHGGVVVNYFPFLRASRRHSDQPVTDVVLADLTLEGNLAENPGPWSDFTLAAIHWANVSDSLVRGCTIRGSVGDGIGVQGGRDNRVESCLVEHCRSHGLHPGTSLRGAVFSGNISRHNGGDGLYFCAQVVGIVVTGNLCHDNAASGIGGLGAGGTGDQFNVVAENVCRHNGRWGIQAVGGKNNVISGNICLDNSQKEPGRYSGIYLADTTLTLLTGNRSGTEAEPPSQKLGIEEHGSSDANVITGNLCEGNRDGGLVIVGPGTQVSANLGSVLDRKP